MSENPESGNQRKQPLWYFVPGFVLGIGIYFAYMAVVNFTIQRLFHVPGSVGFYIVPTLAAIGAAINGNRREPAQVGMLIGAGLPGIAFIVMALLGAS